MAYLPDRIFVMTSYKIDQGLNGQKSQKISIFNKIKII
jgi:hypothetical protein